MNSDKLLGGGLGALPLLSNSSSRSISAENPSGEPSGRRARDKRRSLSSFGEASLRERWAVGSAVYS